MIAIYIPGESMTVQGEKNEIIKKCGKQWNIKEQGKGNGNWLLTKKSDAIVNGISYRNFILERYGKSRLTENLVNKFNKDIKSGKITLQNH